MAPGDGNSFYICQREFSTLGAFIFLLSVILLMESTPSFGQWYKLQTFSDHLGTINFIDSEYPPKYGFVATGHNSDSPIEIWKTQDGGIVWQQLNTPPTSGITSFAFKDRNVLWFSSGLAYGGPTDGCYKTTDGGGSWSLHPNTIGECVSIHYIQNKLYLVRWYDECLASDDEGLSWYPFISSPALGLTGLTFSNQLQGVIAGAGIGNVIRSMEITTDGGLTWQPNGFEVEAWQTLGIQGTSIFFAASEKNNNIYRSDDGGLTWRFLSYQQNTGHIAGSLDNLYLQVNDISNSQIVRSTDQGITWRSICGPQFQYADTRFYVNGNYVYASDRLRSNSLNGSGERLLLSHTSGNRDFVLTAGDNWKTDVALPDTFSTIQWLKLDSLAFTVKYEADVLSLKSTEAASGWELVSATESLGKVSVKLLRESSNDRGVPVASLTFQANIAREKESDVFIDSVYYNAGEFTNCEILASEKLHVTINDECGDSTLRAFLNSKPILEIVSIYPNPTNGDITIDFRSLVDGDVSLEVYDNNVRGLIRKTISAKAGITSVPIDLSQFFGGAFFVQLTLGKDVVTGKFVKQ
jgi:photosystem II stability/assembly factor-like uncharacterized protein